VTPQDDPSVDAELLDCLRVLGVDASRAPAPEGWSDCLRAISEHVHAREEMGFARSRRVVSALSVQAESAARVFEAFLANMGHELRTPLSVVLGSLEMLASSVIVDSEQRTTLDGARRAAISLTRTIDSILDFCRIEAGELGLVRRPFDLGDAVVSVLDRHKATADARGVELELAWNSDFSGRVVGDALRLAQALDALVDNALKFTERGWVRISVALERQDERGLWVRFQVSDTGVGISPEARERLFRPFQQLDQSLAKRHGGIGLGLALTQKLVGLMGGRVELSATLGTGSSFWFSVCLEPCQEAEPRVSRPPQLPSSAPETRRGTSLRPRHSPPRVLVAEDNEFSRLFIVRALEPLGCAVEAVVDGRHAVEAMQRFEPDLVLMDVQMPEMDGLSAAREIRSLGEPFNLVPIVALTANAQHGDRARCSDAGMDAFLAKPVSVPQLREQVTRFLGVSQVLAVASAEGDAPPSGMGESDVESTEIVSLRECQVEAFSPVEGASESDGSGSGTSGTGISQPESSGPQRSVTRSEAAVLAALEAATGTLDLGRLAELVDQAGSADILRELSEIFVSDIASRLDLLSQAHAANDVEGMRRLAHAVKGSAANFGALVMARQAEVIEREPPASDNVVRIVELKAAFAQVRTILEATILRGRGPEARSSRQVG
jgi:signal transduction histidine kinase/CheY-like chemotaxis protein/HPt (histidine-containing phosphotransfer) domain-containing protein